MMLLQELRAYGRRGTGSGTPTLYNDAPLRYIVELNADGSLATPRLTDRADASHPTTKRGKRHPLPQVVRSVGIKPFLIADKADYALGYQGPGAKPERVQQAHSAFVDLLRRCEAATKEPAVAAVVRFLESGQLAALDFPQGFDAGATVSFRIDGELLPVDLPAVQRFWASENDPGQKGAKVMQCLVCGERKPAVERLQLKIKGIPGGQMAGTSLISANADAFTSYGLSASLIAPTCASCGEEFTKAANELLASDRTCVRTAGTAFIFWTREEVAFDLRASFIDADPEQVARLLRSVRTGDREHAVDATRFFAASLTASGGRAVVRDWIDTTVGAVAEHVGQWFRRQEVVDAFGQPHRPLGIMALAFATVREPRDLPAPVTRSLLRAGLFGTPVPPDIVQRLNRRNQADRDVSRQRAALLRLALITQGYIKEEDMVELNTETTSAAYRCGRLFAVLEQAQRLAIPGIKATIADRFYGTASTSPVSVFGRLVAGGQHHLSKLRRDRPGAFRSLDRSLQDILSGLPVAGAGGRPTAWPARLSPQEQGLFALGYYHQRAHDRARAMEAKAQKAAGAAATDEADLESEEEV